MKSLRFFKDAPHGSAFSKLKDASHGSAIFFKIFRILRKEARSSSNVQDAPHGSLVLNERTRERDFLDAPRGTAILNQRTMKFGGCSARERNIFLNFQSAPHRTTICSQCSGCYARERDVLQNFQDAP